MEKSNPENLKSLDERTLFYSNEHLAVTILSALKLVIATIIVTLATYSVLGFLKTDWRFCFIATALLLIIGSSWLYFRQQKTWLQITSQRIIISLQIGLFKNKTHTANLNKIKETAFSIDSSLGSVLSYGTLFIHSDAEFVENRLITFQNLPNVKEVKLFLDRLRDLIDQKTKPEELPMFK